VEETDCAVEPKEVCIVADATNCQDTTFTPSKTSCSEGPERQCESVQTQTCADPEPQQMCAETTQVKCEPETITTCQTKVNVELKEECLEFHEPECEDVYDQICYQGYKPETCKVEDQQECKYVTKPCPPGASRYQCQPTQERICNQINKLVCNGYGPEDKCHTFTSQKCNLIPITSCINIPTIVTKEECTSRIVNNCREQPATECVTVFTTKCNQIEDIPMCFDLPPTCQTEELQPLTNRVCEGQKSDICFNVDSTVCTKTRRNHCFNIPTTSCEKVPVKKCFNIQTPPKLVQIPRKRCVQVPYQACTQQLLLQTGNLLPY